MRPCRSVSVPSFIAVIERFAKLKPPHSLATGSGKSTLAKTVVARLPHFTRISIDEILHARHGIYGADYPADMALYQQHMDEAGAIYDAEFFKLLEAGCDIVLDRSFYAKEDRDDFRSRVDRLGGRVVLVFFKPTDKEVSWNRIVERSTQTKGANNALDISRELFEVYWAGFENPEAEGEIVIDVL